MAYSQKKFCKRCGYPIAANYTYCKKCFYELGCPKDTVVNTEHKCRSCGRTITGRYMYCSFCAAQKGWLK